MPRMFWRLLLTIAFVAFVISSAFSQVDSNVRVVRLSYVNGDVQMDRGTGNGYETALLNMPVVSQAHIRTGEDGEAELEFEGGSTLRLTPGTEIAMSELGLSKSGTHITHVQLQSGQMFVNLRKQDVGDFHIESNGHAIDLRKSAHLRITSDEQQTVVAVLDGDAIVSSTSGAVDVKRNETLTLDNSETERYFLARSVDTGTYDEWDKDREDARALDAQKSFTSSQGYSNYYGPDLDYYGNWVNSPYGTVWQPNYVGAGWSPWQDGSWAWYPSWGWQWVSAYPWGFVPYHYGTWIYVPGYGYCWRRPHRWHHWDNAGSFHGSHDTGVVAKAPGTHATGVVPLTPMPRPPQTFRGSGDTLVAVGRGAEVEWHNPVVKTRAGEREIPTTAFRSGGAQTFGAVRITPAQTITEQQSEMRRAPVARTEMTHTEAARTQSALPRSAPAPARAPMVPASSIVRPTPAGPSAPVHIAPPPAVHSMPSPVIHAAPMAPMHGGEFHSGPTPSGGTAHMGGGARSPR
ncbi:MAG: FecR domain-containing protein [Acidobacteriales bacterium]|nr:FecR domain-containing protein [Terriglobales bacterium]